MTTAPARPPVHAYDGENPFDIIDSAWGAIERWRAVALSTGELGALTVLSKHVKNDSIARMDAIDLREHQLSARTDALSERERNLGVMVAQVTDFVGKASVLFDRIQKVRADAEEEPLPLPPGSLERSSEPKSTEPEPALELEGDAELPGAALTPKQQERDFVEQLRLKHPVKRDQDEPPAGGEEFPDPELPKPPEVQQPIAAGLDEE